jgi:hypothetical protein
VGLYLAPATAREALKIFECMESLAEKAECLIEIGRVSRPVCASVAIVEQTMQCFHGRVVIKAKNLPDLNQVIVLGPVEVVTCLDLWTHRCDYSDRERFVQEVRETTPSKDVTCSE